jgi:NAD(P)H-quinone oxidoreductase subunit 5
VAAAAFAWQVGFADQPALWVLAAVLGVALNPLLSAETIGGAFRGAASAFAIACLYFGLHEFMARWVVPGAGNAGELWWIAAIGFTALFGLQTAIRAHAGWTRSLYPLFYGGLFLDERVSRLLFRLSPPRSV